MKEDKFEEFIRQHRTEFDDAEPGIEVWLNIQKNTDTSSSPIAWRSILWKAAAVLIIFSASFVANEFWHQYRNPAEGIAMEEPVQEIKIPELLEAEVYYTSKVEERMKEIHTYEKENPEIGKELKIEMEELDKAFSELKEDLKDDVANQEIVEAMIQNYRIKLKMLEEIISHLKANKEKEKPVQDEVIQYNM